MFFFSLLAIENVQNHFNFSFWLYFANIENFAPEVLTTQGRIAIIIALAN
jgi:hypothetical protein